LQANYSTQDFKQTFDLQATHYSTPGVGMEFAFKFNNGESISTKLSFIRNINYCFLYFL
jgi:hypothetical protein